MTPRRNPFQTGSLPDEFWVSVLTSLGQGPADLIFGGIANDLGGRLFEEMPWRRPSRPYASPELCALRLTCRRLSNDLSVLFTELNVNNSKPAPGPAWAARFSRVRRVTVHVMGMDSVDLNWLSRRARGGIQESLQVQLTNDSSLMGKAAAAPDDVSLAAKSALGAAAQVEQVIVQRSMSRGAISGLSDSKMSSNLSQLISLLPRRQLLDEAMGCVPDNAKGDETFPSCYAQDATIVHNIHLSLQTNCLRAGLYHWTHQWADCILAAVTSLFVSCNLNLSPEEASLLSQLPRLRKLELYIENFSDEHLLAIGASAAPELQVLENTARSSYPTSMPRVTDRGLAALAGLPSLTRIVLLRSSITSAGVKALRQLIPAIRVYR